MNLGLLKKCRSNGTGTSKADLVYVLKRPWRGPSNTREVQIYYWKLTDSESVLSALFSAREQFLNNLLNNIPLYITQKNSDLEFTYVNKRYCDEVLSLPREQILGRRDKEFFPKNLAKLYESRDRKAISEGSTEDSEEEHIPEGRVGNPQYMFVKKNRIRDPHQQKAGIQAVFWDVTPQVLARNELTEQSEAVEQVVNALVNPTAKSTLIDRILRVTMNTLRAEVCSIFLKKEKNPKELLCVAGTGYAKNIQDEADYMVGEGFTGHIAKTGESFVVNSQKDVKKLQKRGLWTRKWNHLQFRDSPDRGDADFRNLIALPLQINSQIIGVIKVENKLPKEAEFTKSDERTFKIVSNIVALVLQNFALMDRYRNEQKDATSNLEEALREIGNLVSAQLQTACGQYSEIERLVQLTDLTQKTKSQLSRFIEDCVKRLLPQHVFHAFQVGEGSKLAPKSREIAVGFVDIRGYTELSGRLDSSELTTILNTFFAHCGKIIESSGGVLDKYIGDCVMWFHENDDPTQSVNSCIRVAHKIQSDIDQLNNRLHDLITHKVKLELGIGISSGPCTVGIFGGESRRIHYSAVGEAVNLASRICGDASGGSILIGGPAIQYVDTAHIDLAIPQWRTYVGFPHEIKTHEVRHIKDT